MSNVDASLGQRQNFNDRLSKLEKHYSGGGDGGYIDVDGRVTRLETHFDYVRRDLDDIKTDLQKVVRLVDHLPTKRDLESWRIQWVIVGLAIVTFVLTGVVGGLALINHYAASGSPSYVPIRSDAPLPNSPVSVPPPTAGRVK